LDRRFNRSKGREKYMKILLCLVLLSSFALASEERDPASEIKAAGSSVLRVAYVDLQKALQTTDAGKNAKANLEKELTAKKADIEKKQAQIQEEMEKFEKQAAIMNETAKAQKQTELQKKIAEFQKSAAETQMELQRKEREVTKPLIDELRSIIEALGKEKNYQLILEKNEGAVLYAEAGSDLTEIVIDRFNAKHKSKPSAKKK
jgi:outer membrane protein